MKEYVQAQSSDDVCSSLKRFCQQGWPAKNSLNPDLKLYWESRHKFTLDSSHGLLLYGTRIVVPRSLQSETLEKIHRRCRLRARHSIWWPGISTQIKEKVQNFLICVQQSNNPCEPMLSQVLPERPWQKLGADIFYLNGNSYLLIVDYFSRFPEVVKLQSQAVITALMSIFLGLVFPTHSIAITDLSSRQMHWSSLLSHTISSSLLAAPIIQREMVLWRGW